MGRVEARCQTCGSDYMDVMDVTEINGIPVEFLVCMDCLVGYTRSGKDVEKIR